MAHYDARYSSLDGADPSFRDDVLESDALLGFGAVIYRPDVYYAGISMPRFTMGGVGVFGDTRYNFQNSYYFTWAIVLPVGEELHLRPSVLVSYSADIGTHLDGSAMLFVKQLVGVGLGARTQGDLSGLLRLNFSGFGIGYSYQFNPGNQPLNRQINNSTHEIGLSYDFSGRNRIL